MKDFNIEQLAKKTPYKIPENTFEEMQENVLNKTVRKKEHQPKIFKINFSMVTSVAAALALIFGFTFLWKTENSTLFEFLIKLLFVPKLYLLNYNLNKHYRHI